MSESTRQRLATLLLALDPADTADGTEAQLRGRVARLLTSAEPDRVWLSMAVMQAALPTRDRVLETRRRIRLSGADAVLASLGRRVARSGFGRPRQVRVLSDTVIVDVSHTARTGLATGIQRVARNVLRGWTAAHEVTLVGWSQDRTALRALSGPEQQNAVHGTAPHAERGAHDVIIVPWRSTYLLPELAIESERTSRLAALAEFSGNRTGALGFDCVPITSAETTGSGMGGAFAKNLAALARFDRIAAISAAAATEYRGWRRMLSGAGIAGPGIEDIMLPADAGVVDDAAVARARAELVTDGLPLLLCVGSHEPRKNHLAVLNAAERLWREGREFCLAFVGGNSWGSRQFTMELEQLQARGRPVKAISAISDDLLWSGYLLARATVFPSLNEGFGLPVTESLAMGTPVVTSDFGSMREIAAGGGAVLVDPRNDADVARGVAEAMFDDERNAELRAEAAARVDRTWPEYADAAWEYLCAST